MRSVIVVITQIVGEQALQVSLVESDHAMEDAPAIVADDEEAVEQLECNGWDREEVHSGNGFSMVP